MTNKLQCEMGMVGLGIMGQNLLLNMADQGFSVAGYDIDPSKVVSLREVSQQRAIHATHDIKEFINLLRRPCAIMLLVPAGSTVDSIIKELLPYLQPGDLIIDAGNSYFKDTDIRTRYLTAQGIQFLGVGISGGEEGARHGPSIMPGGTPEAYQRVQQVFTAIAAKVNKEPCVAYLGTGSCGHFVKMVHNGIEYAMMQLIAETFDLMKRGLGLTNQQIADVFSKWNKGELSSYLLDITSPIFDRIDKITDKPLIDMITAVAKQNGTGMWSSESALELQVPTPTIDVAVNQRDLSTLVTEREQASALYPLSLPRFTASPDIFLVQLQHALYAGMIIAYAQGMALLAVASEKYQYHLDLEVIARIWRGGCIIRASLLDDIAGAFHRKNALKNLLLDTKLSCEVISHQQDLREIVCQATQLGIPIPGLMASLSYFDAYRSIWLPANLIQAQRDYFGAHTYERIDREGTFHTEWENS